MNYPYVFRQLSVVCFMLGLLMCTSIPWAFSALGGDWSVECRGVVGLVFSMIASFAVGIALRYLGRNATGYFSKKEATAIVGLTWILATLLGALPYLLSGTMRAEGVPLTLCDALFESQSGFSTTGATIFAELERPDLFPRCILFWRCTTHFLGGLGIMVLFVVLLGFGTGTKSIVRSEMTGPTKSNPQDRVHQLSQVVFSLYLAMTFVQTLLLFFQGLSLYDAICHSFSTVSTGGFSTYNASAGHFAAYGYRFAASIEWTLILFMFLGGTNFMLLYWLFVFKPGKLLRDAEWKAYISIILFATIVILVAGIVNQDYDSYGTADRPFYISHADPPSEYEYLTPPTQAPEQVPFLVSVRLVVFQVVSILSTTGMCTDEYEKWNGLSCCVILILIFLGGCAGSTSGGFKIIRAVCVLKSLPQEIELAYRPNVVRPLFIGGEPMERETVRRIMVHFTLITTVFVCGTFLILLIEPAETWGGMTVAGDRKLIDTASAVASCLNNVGPGLGLIGARQNFGVFCETSKFILTWLMLLGRLELFVVLAMFHPGFWKK